MKLSVLVHQLSPSGWWVAQFIEQVMATQAKSIGALMIEIEQIVAAYLKACDDHKIAPWQGPAAPVTYKAKFESAQIRLEDLGARPRDVDLPELEIRLIA